MTFTTADEPSCIIEHQTYNNNFNTVLLVHFTLENINGLRGLYNKYTKTVSARYDSESYTQHGAVYNIIRLIKRGLSR